MRLLPLAALTLLILIPLSVSAFEIEDWGVDPIKGDSNDEFTFTVRLGNTSRVYVDHIIIVLNNGEENTTLYFDDMQDEGDAVVATYVTLLNEGTYTLTIQVSVNGTILTDSNPMVSLEVKKAEPEQTFIERWGCVIAIIVITLVLMAFTFKTFRDRIKAQKEMGSEEMVCSSCSKTVASDADECPHCGENFEGEEYTCPVCNEPVRPEAKKCKKCGKKLKARIDKDPEIDLKLEPKGKKVCPDCGAVVIKKDKSCPGCGKKVRWAQWDEMVDDPKQKPKRRKERPKPSKLSSHEFMCAKCGATVRDSEDVCPECGAKFM